MNTVTGMSSNLHEENARLRAACQLAQATFERYAELHREKGTEDGSTKARSNLELAQKMADALSSASKQQTNLHIDRLRVSDPQAFGQTTTKLKEFKTKLCELLEHRTVCPQVEFRDICFEASKKFIEGNSNLFNEVELFQFRDASQNAVRFLFTSVKGHKIELTATMHVRSIPFGSDES